MLFRFALCGRRRSRTHHCLTIRKLVPIPYNECKVRSPDRVTWSTQRLIPLLETAAQEDLAILKIHSHPGGYEDFSGTDDESDKDLFNSVFGWTDSTFPHASAIMLPGGRMFGRAIMPDGSFHDLDSISVPGDDLHFWAQEFYNNVQQDSGGTTAGYGGAGQGLLPYFLEGCNCTSSASCSFVSGAGMNLNCTASAFISAIPSILSGLARSFCTDRKSTRLNSSH